MNATRVRIPLLAVCLGGVPRCYSVPMAQPWTFQAEPGLSARAFQGILERSGLAARRPAGDLDRLEAMCRNANILITCRLAEGGGLIGVARAVSDFAYCTYLSDLAVDKDYQGQGIGKQLIAKTREVGGKRAALILLSAPDGQDYYPHIGLTKHNSCWVIRREE
jgi:GNAT superfamily N-acetyltransferase